MSLVIYFIFSLLFIFGVQLSSSDEILNGKSYLFYDRKNQRNHAFSFAEEEEEGVGVRNEPSESLVTIKNSTVQSEGYNHNTANKNTLIPRFNDTILAAATSGENNSTAVHSTSTTIQLMEKNTTEGNPPNKEITTEEQNPPEGTRPVDNNSTTTSPEPGIPPITTIPSVVKFVDATTFQGGMNQWDFEGQWGKYNLAHMKEEEKPVPNLQTSEDNVIFMSQMDTPVYLRKIFPPLINATITLTYYIRYPNRGGMSITGYVSSTGGNARIFEITGQDLIDQNLLWTTNKYYLGSYNAQFNLTIGLRSYSKALWAADAITVRGWKVSDYGRPEPDFSEPIVTTQQANNESTTTTERSIEDITITTTSSTTVTSSTAELNPGNSTEIKGDYDELHTDDGHSSSEPWKDLAHIATAIWDAFYVFLALFCACLIALIIMIVKQRCRDDPMPPAMAKYSPRVSTYQVGKPARDNPSYETDSV